jgi:hypothetical protein
MKKVIILAALFILGGLNYGFSATQATYRQIVVKVKDLVEKDIYTQVNINLDSSAAKGFVVYNLGDGLVEKNKLVSVLEFPLPSDDSSTGRAESVLLIYKEIGSKGQAIGIYALYAQGARIYNAYYARINPKVQKKGKKQEEVSLLETEFVSD